MSREKVNVIKYFNDGLPDLVYIYPIFLFSSEVKVLLLTYKNFC